MMRILAIDPGNVQSAFVILYPRLGIAPRIDSSGIRPNDEVLSIINTESGIDHVVIEMVQSFGMAVGKEVFETVFWVGRFYESARCPCDRIYRGDIKMHLCGNMRAKDPNIRQALLDKFGPPGTKKAPGATYGISKDMWSALAVGVTWLETKASL